MGLITVLRNPANRRVFRSTIPVLTLGIMGSALFPLPSAFQTTGIIAATFTMVIVAAATLYTTNMLMHQATATGQHDYETVSYAVGGFWLKLFTQVCIVILLVGTNIGGVVQCGEIFSSAATFLSDSVPDWITERSGSVLMVFTVVLVFPCCLVELMTQVACAVTFLYEANRQDQAAELQEHHLHKLTMLLWLAIACDSLGRNRRKNEWAYLRDLEYISAIGFLFVLMMLFTVLIQSCRAGLPAINNGLDVVGFNDIDSYASSVGTLAFAFYLQPIAMPMLAEMPPGQDGYTILSWSMYIVIGGISFLIYWILGFFGAALWGSDTTANLLQNTLGNTQYQGALNILLGIYLALSLPPIVYPVAHVLNDWLPGNKARYGIGRRVLIMIIIWAVSLGIALAVPGHSGAIVAITGATGVFLACYVVPVVLHLMLYCGWARCQRDPDYTAPKQYGIHHAGADYRTGSGEPTGAMTKPFDAEAAGPKDGGFHSGVRSYRTRVGRFTFLEVLYQILLPVVIVALGALFSILAFKSLATAGL